ncbi:NAD(P)H-hydrate dehydratase [Variovorax dokdonensis]|uniref:Bifunctional NAD(P)H-hydrate repair enzyme n=1 Tax=Variovorax dokdonensis TaxID=344883 RepID=A0ABT7N8N7_9BURK|nr:NAD(P)H-hydrate dehydratase [Variovorax dokdonensis]MDM0044308.1 NAD(P)H-hydrate dehydratase [Variovorax dokdonensis]
MHRITAYYQADLFDVAATRRIERAAAAKLPAHALMRRAGLAVARLAAALHPHARAIWIACGPGNNGGDAFEAAAQLRERSFHPIVTFAGDEARLPDDARDALARARAAGVPILEDAPTEHDLAIDALLGLGATRAPEGRMAQWLTQIYGAGKPVLAVDLPSGLDADTGHCSFDFGPGAPGQRHCLSLLTLKPGLFTAHGRDAAGAVWFDDLGCSSDGEAPCARLAGEPTFRPRAHASHKGSFGDVAILGGDQGMTGAAVLAATAALHGGAGRVFLALLDPRPPSLIEPWPELMLRRPEQLALEHLTIVCGCGGGDAIRTHLARVLAQAPRLVLDADALNAIADDAALGTLLTQRSQHRLATVMTPHPLEAARLLGLSTAVDVQADRLAAAASLARRFQATVVLKGSGTVVASPNEVPTINLTGNARLATGGTGDVLAGMIGAALASGLPALQAAQGEVWRHGAIADAWPHDKPLTAGALAAT